MNGVDFGDGLDSEGRGGLIFGSGKTMLSSVGAGAGTGRAPEIGEWERFRSLEASDSEPFSCDAFGSSDFSPFDRQFSSVVPVSTRCQKWIEEKTYCFLHDGDCGQGW